MTFVEQHLSFREQPLEHRVLLVDDDDAVREMATRTLENKGFVVVAASGVTEALKLITTEPFDVLVTDLHMPNPADGFTVVTAMRHSQPNATTVIVSGYPDVQGAMDTIRLQADEIIMKPVEFNSLAEVCRNRVMARKPATREKKERVSAILHRCVPEIVQNWLARTKECPELKHMTLGDKERTGYLGQLIEDLVERLDKSSSSSKDGDSIPSASAAIHGRLRYQQNYSPAMLVQESRILQVTLFGTLQENMGMLDFSLLLPDVMAIADEVDAQLTQMVESYMTELGKAAAA